MDDPIDLATAITYADALARACELQVGEGEDLPDDAPTMAADLAAFLRTLPEA